jgi:hypothetical protein
MPTFNIGDASGGYYNYRGTNVNPNTVGSSVGTGNWLVSSFSIQAASNSSVSGSNITGQIWNANGNVIWRSGSLNMSGSDNTPPFASRTFSPNIYLPAGTYYFGFSKSNAAAVNWDCVNGNNTSRCGNTVEGDLTYGGTGTIYRRLCGKINYTDVSVPTMSSCSVSAGIGYIDVSWAASSDGGMGITSYAVYRNNDPNQLVYNAAGTSFRDNVGNGVGAYYVVYAYNAVGVSNAAVSGTATTPSVPTMSSCTATANVGSISVSWAASSNGGNAIDYYHIYRNGSYLGQYTGTSLTDNVGNGFTAYYQAYAHNAVGWSGAATSSTVTTPVLAGSPATLVAVADVTQVVLTWTAPTDTGGSPITSYKLEFSTDNINWTQIYNALSPLTYTHIERIPATLYYYRVSAITAVGASSFNNAQAETIGGYIRYFDSLGFVDYVLPEYYSSSASAWKKASAFSYKDGIWVPGDYPPGT